VPDVTPPVISGVAVSNLTGISAKISWKTNEAANSQIEYGPTTGYGSSSKLDPSYVATHAVTLTGLRPNTTYHYRAKSRDEAGNLALSGDLIFTTTATIFSDQFNAAVLDANKWRRGGNSGNQSAVVNNALELRSQGRESGWVITKNAYAARNTLAKVKVVMLNNDGALGISPTYNLLSQSGLKDQKNWYRFYVYREGGAGPYKLYAEWNKNGVEGGRDVTGNLLINGVVYLRLRFDNANIYFEASLNGTTWTKTYAEAFSLPGYTLDSKFYYELSAYNTQVNGTLTVDDFVISSPKSSTAAKPEAENLAATPPPTAFVLQNFPNPFNAATKIDFALPHAAEIQLSVFDLTGREVQELTAGALPAGNYQAVWNGKNREGMALGSGVYFLRLRYRAEGNGVWAQIIRRVMMIR
jgi:chitodextrinase